MDMKKYTRDLLLLSKSNFPPLRSVEEEVKCLNLLLQSIEDSPALLSSFELMDLNRFKIYQDKVSISKALKPKGIKAFQFLVNVN